MTPNAVTCYFNSAECIVPVQIGRSWHTNGSRMGHESPAGCVREVTLTPNAMALMGTLAVWGSMGAYRQVGCDDMTLYRFGPPLSRKNRTSEHGAAGRWKKALRDTWPTNTT